MKKIIQMNLRCENVCVFVKQNNGQYILTGFVDGQKTIEYSLSNMTWQEVVQAAHHTFMYLQK